MAGGVFDEATYLDIIPYQGPLSFMRQTYSRELQGVDLAVYGIPLDCGTTNRGGARLGPRAIREQSIFIGAVEPLYPHEVSLTEAFNIIDYGDLSFNPGYIDHMMEIASTHLDLMVEAGVSTLGLGGDHTITYPAIEAHAKKHGPLSLVHFDAHADDNQHSTIMHGSMFWHAVEKGYVDPHRSIQIGLRHTFPEHEFNVIPAFELLRQQPEDVAARIRELVGEHPCYITLDVDGMDPAYTPGTGTPVPGGMSSAMQREILHGIKGVNAVGGDVVEVSPPYDPTGQTALVGATVAIDILHILAEARSR